MKIIPLAAARSAINSVPKDIDERLAILRYENGTRAGQTGDAKSLRQSARMAEEDPLLSGLLAIRAGTGEEGLPEPAKSTSATMLIYCSKGRGWFDIEGIRFEIVAGNLLIVKPPTRVTWGTSEECPWRVSWVQASGTNIDFFLRELGATKQKPVFDIGEDPQLLGLFEEILEALAEPCCRPRLIYAAQTLGHLFGLLIWHTKNVEQTRPDLNRRVELSIDYMRQHLAKPLHVATLAGLINVSPSYYAVLFKRQTGYSPIDFFIRLRMKQACCLLESTSLHIKEIAASLGYEDPFYFSRVFRSVVRNSPSEYRQSLKRNDTELVREPMRITASFTREASKC